MGHKLSYGCGPLMLSGQADRLDEALVNVAGLGSVHGLQSRFAALAQLEDVLVLLLAQ